MSLQEYSYRACMKATIDIPDDLYQRVKAKSALEGRPVRVVAIDLFQCWLDQDTAPSRQSNQQTPEHQGALTEARRRAARDWLENWLRMGEEASRNAPPG